MKKNNLIAVLAATVLIVAAVGCPQDAGNETTTTTADPGTTTTTTTADPGSTTTTTTTTTTTIAITNVKALVAELKEALKDATADTVRITIADQSPDLSEIRDIISDLSKDIQLNLSECTGLTTVADAAFDGYGRLTSITIPDSVTSIAGGAFSGCSRLVSITIPFVGGSAEATEASESTLFGYIFGNNRYDGARATNQYYASDGSYAKYYIPSSLKNVTVTGGELLRGAFHNCSGLTSVTIGDGVTSIGEYAFGGCSSLTSVTIPDSVTSIGRSAFYNCSGLTSVTIPDSVTSIGDDAFWQCSGLTSVTIGDGVTSIGGYAFYGCSGLTAINVGAGNTAYCSDDGVLFNKDKTALIQYPGGKKGTYTIPNGVTSIGGSAFNGCSGLTSVTIPDSVTSIAGGAFSGCSGLVSMTIPFVGGSAEATEASESTLFGYIFGTISYEGAIATKQYYGSYATYYIPSSLNNVTVTGGKLLDRAFYNCSGLTSVTIGDGVTSIGSRAFSGCSGLTSMTIPDGVTSIGDDAFNWCNGLTSVTIPDSVTSIGGYAFCGCENLASVTIPDGVTSIGDRAFLICAIESLTHPCLRIENGVAINSDNCAIYPANGRKTELVIPDGVTSIGEQAFSEFSNLTSVTIPDSVTSIGRYAFFGISVTSIIIPNSVTSIGGGAFEYCLSLKSVTIPDSVTSIGEGAFSRCSGLTTLSVKAATPPTFGADMFADSDSLETIYVPSSSVDAYTAASGWKDYSDKIQGISTTDPGSTTTTTVPYTEMKAAELEDALKDAASGTVRIAITDTTLDLAELGSIIKSYSSKDIYLDLSKCIGLTTVTDSAFSGCTGLTSITIPGSVTSIAGGAFSGCSGLVSMTIPFVGGSAEASSASTDTLFGYIFGTSSYDGATETKQSYADGSSVSYYIPSSLKNVTVTGGKLLNGVFYKCSVTNITIGSGVTSIGDKAFSGCSGLTAKINAADPPELGSDAFESSAFIIVPADSVIAYKSADGWSDYSEKIYAMGVIQGDYIIDGTTLIGLYNKTITNAVIPSGITSIGDYAFSGCDSLRSVTIPATVTSIGKMAFLWCRELTSVTIDSSVISIGDCAFLGCVGLQDDDGFIIVRNVLYGYYGTSTEIVIPDGVTRIGAEAFGVCDSLTSVTIPNSVTSIGDFAFSMCDSLMSVKIPASVTSIGIGAFISGFGMTVEIEAAAPLSIGTNAFALSALIIVPADSVSAYKAADDWEIYRRIYGNQSIQDGFVIENAVLIGPYDKTITNAVIPSGITSIGDYAFQNCRGLTTLTVKATTPPTFGSCMLDGCSSLTTIYVPSSSVDAYTASDGWKSYSDKIVGQTL